MKTAVEEFIHELEGLILIGDLHSLRWSFRDLANKALEKEKEQMKNMYLKGIENYDPTFKRKSQWTEVSKTDKL
jgi:hypothetical protein